MRFVSILLLALVPAFTSAQTAITTAQAAEIENALLSSSAASSLNADSLAEQLGGDVPAIVSYVRRQIRYQHYKGILRGIEGTLHSRAGNAFDQALLLHRMLRKAGSDAELWRGVLTREWSEKLLSKAIEEQSEKFDQSGLISEISADEEVLRGLRGILGGQLPLEAELSSKAKGIHEGLPVELLPVPPAPEAGPMDYMWVRIRREEGFVDIHPAFAEEDVVEVREMAYAEVQTSLPRELFHSVRVRLVAERPGVNDFTRQVLLERIMLPMAMNAKTAKIYLSPRFGQPGQLSIKPVFRVGDIVLSAQRVSVPYDENKQLPGTISALYLEVTTLPAGGVARQQSYAIADSLPGMPWTDRTKEKILAATPLQPEDFYFSADLLVASGGMHPVSLLLNDAKRLRRLTALVSEDGLQPQPLQFALEYHRPLLRYQWRLTRGLANLFAGAYINGPLVVTSITRHKAGSTAQTDYYLSHLEFGGRAAGQAALFSALLARAALGGEETAPDVNVQQWRLAGEGDAENAQAALELMRGSQVAISETGWWVNRPRASNMPVLNSPTDAIGFRSFSFDGQLLREFEYLPDLPGVDAGEADWKAWISNYINSSLIGEESPLNPFLE